MILVCLIISAAVALLIAFRHADSLSAVILALFLLSLSKAYTDCATSGLVLRLLFEMLGQLNEDYSLWFHIKAVNSDKEWMIYDYKPETPVTTWVPPGIYEFADLIKVAPGRYDIAFGFWTPARDRLYVDQENDIYWISLGEFEAPEMQ